MISRRKFFGFSAGAPFIRLPKFSCHKTDVIEKGEFSLITFEATRNRDAPPFVEIERWVDDVGESVVCNKTYINSRKIREHFNVGEWPMYVPPIVMYPSRFIIPIQETCKIWFDKQEINWRMLEKQINPFGYIHRYGKLN